jgi:hypothetical protein
MMNVIKPGVCLTASKLIPGALFCAEFDNAIRYFLRAAQVNPNDQTPVFLVAALTPPPERDYEGKPGLYMADRVRAPALAFGDDVAFKIDETSRVVGDDRRQLGYVAIVEERVYLLVGHGPWDIAFLNLADGRVNDTEINIYNAAVFSRWSIVRQGPHGITELATYPPTAPASATP